MAIIRPFRALRPDGEKAADVACVPYDVVSTEEARALAEGKPWSFLRVIRSEIELPEDTDPHSAAVYLHARKRLEDFEREGVLKRDPAPTLTLYRQKMGAHVQTGIVGLFSCKEYDEEIIRKHELTRPDKEMDRVEHIKTLKAHNEPVLLTYRAQVEIDTLVAKIAQRPPSVHFTASDGIEHTCWLLTNSQEIGLFEQLFSTIPLLYIADGHHRSAASSHVARYWRDQGETDRLAASQMFLAVAFPHDQMQILPYNRFVHDLKGHTPESFLRLLRSRFEITERPSLPSPSPEGPHIFDMFLQGRWYRVEPLPNTWDPSDPLDDLDVNILQNQILDPILGIEDPRRDKRISFVGGIRGHKELEKLVAQTPGSVAFACYPTSLAQLLAVADTRQIMPPKSTWFEPKLRSGLFLHPFDRV